MKYPEIPFISYLSKKVRENLKKKYLANRWKIVDIQVPLRSHFPSLIIFNYFGTKCFSQAYILILHSKCSSGDPWNISLAVFWPEQYASKDILFSWKFSNFYKKKRFVELVRDAFKKKVYLWRSFFLARKLLMGCFRGPLNYILDVQFKNRL